MKERPILFSATMVRALLAGTKTQTRRVGKPAPAADARFAGGHYFPGKNKGASDISVEAPYVGLACPYGQTGDRLRVKEAAWMWCERRPNGKTKTGRDKWVYVPMREAHIHYAADHPKKPAIDVASPNTGNTWGWRLKVGRFLPAWASRITLEVTGVRVERLQDISRGDAMAEGCPFPNMAKGDDPRQWYAKLWNDINGPGSWDANPWVWVVQFKRAAQ